MINNKIILTEKALALFKSDTKFASEVQESLIAFNHCDWGLVPPDFSDMNDRAYLTDDTIIAMYLTYLDMILIVYNAKRDITTLMLGDEISR